MSPPEKVEASVRTIPEEDLLLTIASKVRKNHQGLIVREYVRPDGSSYETTEIPTSVLRSLGKANIAGKLTIWKSGERARIESKSRKELIVTLLSNDPPLSVRQIADKCECSTAYVRLIRNDLNKERRIGIVAQRVIAFLKANPTATVPMVASATGASRGYICRMRRAHGHLISPPTEAAASKSQVKQPDRFISNWPKRTPDFLQPPK
jgi:hypothetical protein